MLPPTELFPVESWRQLALCAQADPDMWFPEKGDHRSARRAKEVCRRCPVRVECAEYAMAEPSLDGVWGGTTYLERRQLRRGEMAS